MTTDKMIEQLTYFMEDSDPKTLELIVAKLREQEARLQAAEELADAVDEWPTIKIPFSVYDALMKYRAAGLET